jgi:hypothetical protein
VTGAIGGKPLSLGALTVAIKPNQNNSIQKIAKRSLRSLPYPVVDRLAFCFPNQQAI